MANTGNTAQFKILYGEGNEQVLNAQAESMQKAGHKVEKASNRKLVEALLRHESFDLVVLGPTLTRDDRHHLPYMVKKSHPGTRVLVIVWKSCWKKSLRSGRWLQRLAARASSFERRSQETKRGQP